jgi:signal peptidase I
LNQDPAKDNTDDIEPKGKVRENIEALLIAIILALFIRTFIVQAFKIPSGSMLDTLQIGDHILVNKFIYGVKIPFLHKTLIPVKDPVKGDIIVFIYPIDKRDFIKRVVAVGGDTLEIKNKKIYVNGVMTDDSSYVRFESDDVIPPVIPREKFESIWLDELKRFKEVEQADRRFFKDNFGPITVPSGHVFVMGDNRDNSHDSRFWGFVPLDAVLGKAFIIYWSWDSEHFGVRWNRLGRLLK